MKNTFKTIIRSKGLEDFLAKDKAYSSNYQEAVLHAENLRAGKLNNKYQSEYTSWRNRKKWAKDHEVAWYEPMNEFSGFLIVNGPIPTKGWTLDRIDSKGGYTPKNMRWASKATQSQNRTTARVIEFNGQPLTLNELALRTGATYDSIRMGLNRHGEQYLEKLNLPDPSVSTIELEVSAWEFPKKYRYELERMYEKRLDKKSRRPRFFLELLAYEIRKITGLLKTNQTLETAAELISELVVLNELFDTTKTFVYSVNRAIYIDRHLQNKPKFHIPPNEATVGAHTQEFDPDDFFMPDKGELPWAFPPSGNDPVFKSFS